MSVLPAAMIDRRPQGDDPPKGMDMSPSPTERRLGETTDRCGVGGA